GLVWVYQRRSIALTSRGADQAPKAFGRGGHRDVADAERRQRVGERVADGRQGADRTGLAGALDAERVGLGRHRVRLAMQRTEIASARHRVIHKGAGDELRRFRVEMDILEHDLADALRDAAMDL